MNKKNMFYIKRNPLCLFLFALFFYISNISTQELDPCNGLIQQVEELQLEQKEFGQSLEEISTLQSSMNDQLCCITQILTSTCTVFYFTCVDEFECCPKSIGFNSKMPTKQGEACNEGNIVILQETLDKIINSINTSYLTNEVLRNDLDFLANVITSQFTSVDTLYEMHVKMDSILDLLSTSTQLAVELNISLTDCELSLHECLDKSCALWDDYMDDIVVSPDDIFWSFEALE